MREGMDNVITWVRIASKAKIQQPGGQDSARLRMVGIVERHRQRGIVISVEQVHIPLEARGRLALAMDRDVHVGTGLWVFGEHSEDVYIDVDTGKEQHKLKVIVDSYQLKREIDLRDVFKNV